jgi:mono/diheme cytochrome c family protein
VKRDSFVAGLAVSLGGGIIVIGLLVLMFQATSNSSGAKTTTVTVSSTATLAGTSASKVAPDVVAGARDFVAFACGACHGWQGQGTPPYVPSLTAAGKVLDATQLRSIINKGAGVSANPTQPFMPVWGAVMSDQQVADLAAYVKSGLPPIAGISTVTVPAGLPDSVSGGYLYTKLGCINCHGPNGRGGVPNPSSPDTVIPPLSGPDFVGQFKTDKSISDVILSGSVIGKNPIVDMPHWGGILTQAEVNQLVAYIRTLKTTK